MRIIEIHYVNERVHDGRGGWAAGRCKYLPGIPTIGCSESRSDGNACLPGTHFTRDKRVDGRGMEIGHVSSAPV